MESYLGVTRGSRTSAKTGYTLPLRTGRGSLERRMATGDDEAERGMALRQLQQACKALREDMTTMYEQRSRPHGGREPDEARLKQQRWRVLLLLGAIKAGLRDTFLVADERKARVQEKKDVAEAHQLQLQNLLYEKDHLLREIRRCRGFSTKEMDKIEFANEDLPIAVDADVHRSHLDQLTEELHARKRLQAELKALKEKIAKVEAATETKQSFLDTLPQQLTGIEAATTGLQSYMGEPISAQRDRQHSAGVELPTPLYALYCELEAYQTASGDAGKQLTLEIVDSVGLSQARSFRKRGFPSALDRNERSVSAAKKLKAPSRSPSAAVNGTTPPLLPPSRAPSRSPSAKRGGVNGTAQEPESGEIVASHTAEKLLELRPHASASEEESSESKHQEDDENMEVSANPAETLNLWKPHAKALQLTIAVESSMASASGSFTLMFQYFTVAKVVTAEVVKTTPASYSHSSHHQNILTNLFPGDDGLSVPRLAVNYAFREDGEGDGEVEFPADAACRPYYWTQWICGLNPMKRADASDSDEAPRRRPEPSVRNVMSQLVKRFEATLLLKKHLDQLTKLTAASTSSTPRTTDDGTLFVHPLASHLFPHEVKTYLEDWKEIPAPTQDVFQPVKRPQFHMPMLGCRYYRAGFKNGRAKVSAIVEIAPEYPIRAPRFLFQPRSASSNKAMDKDQLPLYENQLKELEVEVNAFYDELIPKGSEQFLLLHQLRKVEMCFDVLCSAADGDADVPLCFGRERRGKDRRQAMVMDTAAKDLRHR
ncbi:hypothetical protein BBJ28_00018550 [Nothophytophthora sp. Chile5]|nr:hypothetical protein BBJ28_00018550 [Nothophytophthora sp. Chile5]